MERILDATEEIIRSRGVDAVTIPEVARAAKASVGSFYARFPSKTALLTTLHERACSESVATAERALDPERWQHTPTIDIIRTFIGFSVALFRERQPMMLAFNAALGGEPGFEARRAKTAVAIALKLRNLLLSRRHEISHPHPDRAVDMSLRVVTATLEQRNAFESSNVPEVSLADEALADELSRMVLGYLGIKPR